MSAKFDDLEKKIKENDEKIHQLEKTIENLVEKQKSLLSEIENLEQYSRRNCLVLHGVDESNDENTNSHRLGKPKRTDNKPRPIIVKFACYTVRKEIFMNKRKLKGKRLLITESLTFSRMQ